MGRLCFLLCFFAISCQFVLCSLYIYHISYSQNNFAPAAGIQRKRFRLWRWFPLFGTWQAHDDFIAFLRSFDAHASYDPLLAQAWAAHAPLCRRLRNLNLDPVRDFLAGFFHLRSPCSLAGANLSLLRPHVSFRGHQHYQLGSQTERLSFSWLPYRLRSHRLTRQSHSHSFHRLPLLLYRSALVC